MKDASSESLINQYTVLDVGKSQSDPCNIGIRCEEVDPFFLDFSTEELAEDFYNEIVIHLDSE